MLSIFFARYLNVPVYFFILSTLYLLTACTSSSKEQAQNALQDAFSRVDENLNRYSQLATENPDFLNYPDSGKSIRVYAVLQDIQKKFNAIKKEGYNLEEGTASANAFYNNLDSYLMGFEGLTHRYLQEVGDFIINRRYEITLTYQELDLIQQEFASAITRFTSTVPEKFIIPSLRGYISKTYALNEQLKSIIAGNNSNTLVPKDVLDQCSNLGKDLLPIYNNTLMPVGMQILSNITQIFSVYRNGPESAVQAPMTVPVKIGAPFQGPGLMNSTAESYVNQQLGDRIANYDTSFWAKKYNYGDYAGLFFHQVPDQPNRGVPVAKNEHFGNYYKTFQVLTQ